MIDIREHGGPFGGGKKLSGEHTWDKIHVAMSVPLQDAGVERILTNHTWTTLMATELLYDHNMEFVYFLYKGESQFMSGITEYVSIAKYSVKTLTKISESQITLSNAGGIVYYLTAGIDSENNITFAYKGTSGAGENMLCVVKINSSMQKVSEAVVTNYQVNFFYANFIFLKNGNFIFSSIISSNYTRLSLINKSGVKTDVTNLTLSEIDDITAEISSTGIEFLLLKDKSGKLAPLKATDLSRYTDTEINNLGIDLYVDGTLTSVRARISANGTSKILSMHSVPEPDFGYSHTGYTLGRRAGSGEDILFKVLKTSYSGNSVPDSDTAEMLFFCKDYNKQVPCGKVPINGSNLVTYVVSKDDIIQNTSNDGGAIYDENSGSVSGMITKLKRLTKYGKYIITE